MNRKLIDVIYVNYNSARLIENSLNSMLRENSQFINQVLIVDNSCNFEKTKNSESSESIKIIHTESNIGFAKANNLAAFNCDSEFICFLNPDTLVNQDFFSSIIRFIESNPQAGACAPRLVYEDGSFQDSSGSKMGLWYEFLEATFLIAISRKLQRKRILSLTKLSVPLKVGWVSAACMILKRSVFEKIGGFTEEYFLNYEDIELCHKLEDSGYNNYLFTDLECVHLDHKSFQNNYELLVYSRYESRLIYAKLHYSHFTSLLVRSIHILGLVARIVPSLIVYRGNERTGRIRGYLKSLKLYFRLKSAIRS